MDKSVQVIYWDTSAVLSALFTDTHSQGAIKWSAAAGVHFRDSMALGGQILKETKIPDNRTLFTALILIFCVFINFSYAAESELTLEQILDRVEKHYTGKSFQASFIQESTIKAMDIVDFASGKIFVRYPGMMRWEYEKPERQTIITDGHKLWIYRPADNQVLTGSAPAFFSDGKGASFLSDIKLVRKKFEISLENSKEDFFYELMLQPLEKKLDVTDIRLSVTKNTFTVIRIITYNSYGDENRIEFTNHQFDVKLDESLFSFKIPPGADVLQLDE